MHIMIILQALFVHKGDLLTQSALHLTGMRTISGVARRPVRLTGSAFNRVVQKIEETLSSRLEPGRILYPVRCASSSICKQFLGATRIVVELQLKLILGQTG